MSRLFLILLLISATTTISAQRPGRYRIYSSKLRHSERGKWVGDTSYISRQNMILVISPTRLEIVSGDSVMTYLVIDQGYPFYEGSIQAMVTRYKLDTDKEHFIEGQLAFYDDGKETHTGLLAIKSREITGSYRFYDLQDKEKNK